MSDLFMEMHSRRAKQRSGGGRGSLGEDRWAPELEPEPEHSEGDDEDPLSNVLSLKLRKPKGWQWELTTSRSCTNIALPRILLYNHKGDLLVDAHSQEEQVWRQDACEPATTTRARKQRKATSRAATANLEGAVRRALDREFGGLQIAEATPSPEPPYVRQKTRVARHAAPIELQTNELPDYKFERRATSFKEVRFKVDDEAAAAAADDGTPYLHVVDLPTPPSTTTTTPTATTTNSSSSGTREKRRYRRSQSSLATSESILERFSFNRGRFSSPEYADEQLVAGAPRYYLRTSKAGTLVVQADSFSRYKRRRKPRHSSAENMLNESSSKSRSTGSLKSATATLTARHLQLPADAVQGGSLQNVSEQQERARKKTLPVRRYRSDGNMLLQQRRSSSSDTEAECKGDGGASGTTSRPLRKYGDYRRQSRKGLVTIDPANGIVPALERPTR